MDADYVAGDRGPGMEATCGCACPGLASQGRLDPGVALVEKPFSAADRLAKAREVLNDHFRGFANTQENPC